MSNSVNQSKSIDYRVVGLMLIVAAIIGVAYLTVPISITLTITTLLGIWAGDAFLKYHFELGTETSLADLSFTVFVFAFSRGLDAITTVSGTGIKENQLLSAIVVGFILGIFWLVNLVICRDLRYPKSLTQQRKGILVSVAITCLSLVIAVLAQSNGVI